MSHSNDPTGSMNDGPTVFLSKKLSYQLVRPPIFNQLLLLPLLSISFWRVSSFETGLKPVVLLEPVTPAAATMTTTAKTSVGRMTLGQFNRVICGITLANPVLYLRWSAFAQMTAWAALLEDRLLILSATAADFCAKMKCCWDVPSSYKRSTKQEISCSRPFTGCCKSRDPLLPIWCLRVKGNHSPLSEVTRLL